MSKTIELFGENIRLEDKLGLASLIDFAVAAEGGTDSSDMAGLVAIKTILRECVVPEDFDRFWSAARASRADGEELMKVVTLVIEAMSERPTSRPSDSSDGPTSIEPRSEDDSYWQVVRRLEDEGRADKAEFVVLAQQAKAGSMR